MSLVGDGPGEIFASPPSPGPQLPDWRVWSGRQIRTSSRSLAELTPAMIATSCTTRGEALTYPYR